MAIALQIAVTGDEAVERRIARLGQRARDGRPVLREIADMVEDAQRARLNRGQGGMKRLDPDTLTRKRRQGIDPRPLHGATGDLLRSVTSNSRGSIRHIDRDEMVFGTSIPYARFHDIGIGVPRRRVVALATRQRQPIAQEILDWLMGHGRWAV